MTHLHNYSVVNYSSLLCKESNGSAAPNYNHTHPRMDAIEKYLKGDIHGYITVFICMAGLLMNGVTLVILTHKSMRTPINFLLCCISVADTLTILFYTPMLMMNLSNNPFLTENYSRAYAYYRLIAIQVTIICHSVSNYITTMLGAFRVIMVRLRNGMHVTGYRNSGIAVFLCVIFTIVLLIPKLMLYSVHHCYTGDPVTTDDFKIKWFVNLGKMGVTDPNLVQATRQLADAVFWIVAMSKIVSCGLLAIISGLLIRTLWKAQSKYNKLHKMTNAPKIENSETFNLLEIPEAENHRSLSAQSSNGHFTNTQSSKKAKQRNQQTNRTTLMLLVVVITFAIVELPIALLTLFSGVLGNEFFDHVYLKVGHILDLLVIINSSINFVIYCAMSDQFCKTFFKLVPIDRCFQKLKVCKKSTTRTEKHLEDYEEPQTRLTQLNSCSSLARELTSPKSSPNSRKTANQNFLLVQ